MGAPFDLTNHLAQLSDLHRAHSCLALQLCRILAQPQRTPPHTTPTNAPPLQAFNAHTFLHLIHPRLAAKRWRPASELSSERGGDEAAALDLLDGWDGDDLTLNGSRCEPGFHSPEQQ